MAIVRNLVANSLNQGVSFLVNIIAVPIYLGLLGVEQYGLIGFALVVQMWVNLLEVGMSGTLGREMTRMMIGDVSEASVLSFLRSLDWLFLGGAILLGAVGWISRALWAHAWFTREALDPAVINECVVLIIALAAVRLAGTLYRGGLMGLERQVFVSAVSIGGSVARLALPLPLVLSNPDVRIVISAWLIVSVVELAIMRIALAGAFSSRVGWCHFSIRELWNRADLWGSIGFLAIVWTAITQTDKLILSRVLPLADYGRFTLVMILSNAILSISAPICFAFQPRMTSAATRGDSGKLAGLVENATRIVMIFVVAPAFALAALPRTAILAWTGDAGAAAATSQYLGPYVLGSAMVSFAAIVYAVQYAYGDLRLHVRANLIFAALLIPSEIFVASRFGAFGAAWLWLAINGGLLALYCPLIFHRFLPGRAATWYAKIIAPPAIASAVAAWGVGSLATAQAAGRVSAILATAATGLAACAAAALATLAFSRGELRQLRIAS